MAISSLSSGLPQGQALEQAGSFNDLASLDQLRSAAQRQDDGALRKVALQFESIFMQMLLKGMRQANAAFESDDLNSNYTKFYRDMSDQQLSLQLSQQGALGLADVMVEQLSPQDSKITPASVLRLAESSRPHSVSMPAADLSSELSKPHSGVPLRSAETPRQEELKFETPEDFVQQLLPLAQKTASDLGLDPKAILAQAALETGWGQKVLRNHDGSSSFNLFNIKASRDWQGGSTRVTTLEFEQGVPVKKLAAFRSYQSFAQSFGDYKEFLSNSGRYDEALESGDDSAGFLQNLQYAGYATDPDYATKALSVLRKVTGILNP